MIHRDAPLKAVQRLLRSSPVVALLGARQVGKTTLARQLSRHRRGPTHFFDLESSADAARLADPLLALSSLKGIVVLDEIQRRPELFPTLRVLADRRPRPARFLVLGSASPGLLRQSSESPGRTDRVLRAAVPHVGGNRAGDDRSAVPLTKGIRAVAAARMLEDL